VIRAVVFAVQDVIAVRVLAGVPIAIAVVVGLVRVRVGRTVVAPVARPVCVAVRLVGVGRPWAVVLPIGDSVVVLVGLTDLKQADPPGAAVPVTLALDDAVPVRSADQGLRTVRLPIARLPFRLVLTLPFSRRRRLAGVVLAGVVLPRIRLSVSLSRIVRDRVVRSGRAAPVDGRDAVCALRLVGDGLWRRSGRLGAGAADRAAPPSIRRTRDEQQDRDKDTTVHRWRPPDGRWAPVKLNTFHRRYFCQPVVHELSDSRRETTTRSGSYSTSARDPPRKGPTTWSSPWRQGRSQASGFIESIMGAVDTRRTGTTTFATPVVGAQQLAGLGVALTVNAAMPVLLSGFRVGRA
jgi:hypothetical protein